MKLTRILSLKSTTITLLLTLIVVQTAYTQKKISKASIEEDITILKRNLEEIHADLYLYSSKKEVDSWFKKLRSNLKDSITPFEFYKLLAPLNSIIKNGHTNISYPKFGSNFYFLPIQLYEYKNSFYIKKSFSKQFSDIEGSQILEINGIAINEVYKRLLTNYTRDGNNLSMPYGNLSSLFGLEYPIVYGKNATYTLTLLREEKQFQVTIPQELLNEEIIQQYNEGNKSEPLSFQIDGNVATLVFPTFDTKSLKKANYKTLLKKSFAEIKSKNIEHLIIDVRNNGGGDPIPTQELISYLSDKDFIMYKDVYTITHKVKDKKYYKKQGIFWLNSFGWLKVKKIKDKHYRVRKAKGMDVYAPKTNNFKGQLYILTNGNSFSATGEFTSFIKNQRNNLTFIGEQVGGNALQNTSGIMNTITLPNSKQKVTIPLVTFEMNINSENTGYGINPDHKIKNTIQDELNNKDRVMDFTIELIKKSKN